MDPWITTLVVEAKDFLNEAQEFYKSCGRNAELNPADKLVIGFANETLVGIVRCCFENQEHVLRTMQIHPIFQRRGLGTLLLNRFDDLIREHKISKIYCMPYEHLEDFYSQIGFQKIEVSEAPEFLQERVRDFYRKRKDQSVILMRRTL